MKGRLERRGVRVFGREMRDVCGRRALMGVWLVAMLLFAPGAVTTFGRDSQDASTEPATPQSVSDLREIESRVGEVMEKVLPATVSIRAGRAYGSGVIVSANGYVLTAGHVASEPGQKVTVWLHHGRRLDGVALGINDGMDSGLVKITTEGDWPFVEMRRDATPRIGQWCVALGHPGGYKPGRPAVLRLGRVISKGSRLIQTDCALTAGDSGGPLFDLDGEVLGIHSRIGNTTSANFHVPIETFSATWDRLVAGERWDDRGLAFLGIDGLDHERGALVRRVHLNTPASQAELRSDDIIMSFDGELVDSFEALRGLIVQHKPGDEVIVSLLRGGDVIEKRVTLSRHPELARRDDF